MSTIFASMAPAASEIGRSTWTLLVAATLLLSGCDQADLQPPELPPTGDRFASYVAIGNSITAGFQGDGIRETTQLESYAVKVAEQMGTEFNSPLLAEPGCAPPLSNPFTGERVGQGTDDNCSLRKRPVPDVLYNVAVPGAATIDVLDNLDEDSNANELTLLMLGGRTQIEAAAEANPTFVSVWIGDNDVLRPALAGTDDGLTPVPTFEQRYTAILDSLDGMGVEEGVLLAVGDVTLIPYFSPGAAYFQAKQQNQLPPTFDVDDNCGPAQAGSTTLVPFRYGFGTLLRLAQEGEPVRLDCVNDPNLLSGSEIQTIKTTVAAYNSFIENQATEQGWAFVNINPILQSLRASGDIPPFPNVTNPPEAFGPYFSLDGVHPNGLAHRVVANEVIDAINDTYETEIDPPVERARSTLVAQWVLISSSA